MISFKQYLEEVNQQFLYHNTSFVAFQSILNLKKIGVTDNFDTIKGHQSVKRGWVSFSRNKSYKAAPGATDTEVRLVFLYDKLKQRYKNAPYADLMVAKSLRDYDFVRGHESRWESEERFMGPIDIKYAEYIEILKSVYNARINYIKSWKEGLEELGTQREKLNDGYFWHGVKKSYEKLSDFPKVTKERIEERIDSSEKHYNEMIKEYEKIFSDPRIKIVDKIGA